MTKRKGKTPQEILRRRSKKKTKAKPTPKVESPVSDWDKLRELIAEYAEAYVADSWKGGGDPADYVVIEANLKLQAARLHAHIRRMESDPNNDR